mgnify:CR=1 FL=1
MNEFVILLHRLTDEPFSEEAVRAHVDRLAELDDEGRLVLAGPMGDGTGGLVVARFADEDAAQAFADSEPFVTGGWETATVHPWIRADRSNDYLDPTLPERRGR